MSINISSDLQDETLNEISEKELPRLSNQISQELCDQKDKSIEIIRKFLTHLEELNENLDKDSEHQKQYEGSIFEMFKDVVSRAQKELETEKNERVLNQKNLFMLIENAFQKVNQMK